MDQQVEPTFQRHLCQNNPRERSKEKKAARKDWKTGENNEWVIIPNA